MTFQNYRAFYLFRDTIFVMFIICVRILKILNSLQFYLRTYFLVTIWSENGGAPKRLVRIVWRLFWWFVHSWVVHTIVGANITRYFLDSLTTLYSFMSRSYSLQVIRISKTGVLTSSILALYIQKSDMLAFTFQLEYRKIFSRSVTFQNYVNLLTFYLYSTFFEKYI